MPISDGAKLHEHGPWVGCNAWLAATVALGAVGGVLTSVVLKYADTILKSFAVGCSIALACLLSRIIFDSPVCQHIALRCCTCERVQHSLCSIN